MRWHADAPIVNIAGYNRRKGASFNYNIQKWMCPEKKRVRFIGLNPYRKKEKSHGPTILPGKYDVPMTK